MSFTYKGLTAEMTRHIVTDEETERQLQKAIPKQDWVKAHHWLIFHGRRVCHARNPQCAGCAIQPLCKAAKAAGGAVSTPSPKKKVKSDEVNL